MKKIVKENLKFSVYELPRPEAIELMEERGEKYKVEHYWRFARRCSYHLLPARRIH